MTNTNVNAILPEINDNDARACSKAGMMLFPPRWDSLSEFEKDGWRSRARAVRDSLSQRMAEIRLADVLPGLDAIEDLDSDDLKNGHWVNCTANHCDPTKHTFHQKMYASDGSVIASWCFEFDAEAQAAAEIKQIITKAAANQNQCIDATKVLKALSDAGWTLAREEDDEN